LHRIIFLSLLVAGCNGFPTISPQERCFTLLDTENIEIVKDETYYKGVCQCQLYEWNSEHIGRISTPITKPLVYCDKFAGFSPDSTGEIYKFQESVRLWLKRNKK
jgi:hypothetical protein